MSRLWLQRGHYAVPPPTQFKTVVKTGVSITCGRDSDDQNCNVPEMTWKCGSCERKNKKNRLNLPRLPGDLACPQELSLGLESSTCLQGQWARALNRKMMRISWALDRVNVLKWTHYIFVSQKKLNIWSVEKWTKPFLRSSGAAGGAACRQIRPIALWVTALPFPPRLELIKPTLTTHHMLNKRSESCQRQKK